MATERETRQIYYERFGEPADVLKLRTTLLPEPYVGHALIRMVKAPVHPADLAAVRGRYGGATEPGYPGIEGLGVVEASPSGRFGVGMRVAIAGGTALWSDRALVDENILVPVPEGLAATAACQLFVNPLTARIMLSALPDTGFTLQAAANSALGRMVNRIAVEDGRKLISIVRRPEAAALLRSEGASHVVDSSDPDWLEQVRAIAGREPISGALDPIGGTMSLALSGLLSPGGVLTIYGGLDNATPAAIDIGALIFGNISVRGFWLTRWLHAASDAEKASLIGQVFGDFLQGRLTIPIEAEYGLNDYREAAQRAESTKAGKVLLDLAG